MIHRVLHSILTDGVLRVIFALQVLVMCLAF